MGIYLTKHEGQQFESQTIMISGQAFISCTFRKCTYLQIQCPIHFRSTHFPETFKYPEQYHKYR